MRHISIVLLIMLGLFGCGGGNSSAPSDPALKTIKSIEVMPKDNKIAVGDEAQFNLSYTYSDNTTQNIGTGVIWNSSNKSVADISSNGKVTSKAPGETEITATITDNSGKPISYKTTLIVSPLLIPIPTDPNAALADVRGTWTGSYTIYDSTDPTEIGTYSYKFVLAQNVNNVTGTPTLRGIASGELIGNVTGRQLKFSFKYPSPKNSSIMENVGTAEITGNSMTGDVRENHRGGYNCSYTFTLVKQP